MSNTTIYVHCKKDFKGLVDFRDYVVKKAMNEGKSITATCGSYPGKSIYTPEELENPIRISESFTARYGNIKSYKLYSYKWKDE